MVNQTATTQDIKLLGFNSLKLQSRHPIPSLFTWKQVLLCSVGLSPRCARTEALMTNQFLERFDLSFCCMQPTTRARILNTVLLCRCSSTSCFCMSLKRVHKAISKQAKQSGGDSFLLVYRILFYAISIAIIRCYCLLSCIVILSF